MCHEVGARQALPSIEGKMKITSYILSSIVVVVLLATIVTWQMSRPIFDEMLSAKDLNNVEIAPLETAFTLARTKSGDVVFVLGADGSGIVGVNLGARFEDVQPDSIGAYHTLGPAKLRALAEDGERSSFDWEELTTPVIENYPHVAAGTNFKAHAEEVGHEGEPFLFPKLSHATPWNADVIDGTRLDYELEICAVPLTDHSSDRPSQLGYVLCGDFTDRWLLAMNIDLDQKMGLTGFPLAKGGETRLPVGALFVIPNEDAFYQDLEISLYVNGELRQRSSGDLMIWSPQEIMSRTLADCESAYLLNGDVLRISDCDYIPARTIVLTGTPEGVLFKATTLLNPLAYLSDGDVVVSTGKYLGHMRNEIVDQ